MKRLGLILVTSWLMTISTSKAGELDSEYGGPSREVKATPLVVEKHSSELDSESPTQACCLKRKLCRIRIYNYYGFYGPGPVCCGFSYGAGFGYGGFAGYGGGFGGYGGGFW